MDAPHQILNATAACASYEAATIVLGLITSIMVLAGLVILCALCVKGHDWLGLHYMKPGLIYAFERQYGKGGQDIETRTTEGEDWIWLAPWKTRLVDVEDPRFYHIRTNEINACTSDGENVIVDVTCEYKREGDARALPMVSYNSIQVRIRACVLESVAATPWSSLTPKWIKDRLELWAEQMKFADCYHYITISDFYVTSLMKNVRTPEEKCVDQ